MNDNKSANIDRIEINKVKGGYIIRTWPQGADRLSLPSVDVVVPLPDLVEKVVEHFQWEFK